MIEDLANGAIYQVAKSLTFVSDVIGSRKNPYQIVLGEEVLGLDSVFTDSSTTIHRMDGNIVSTKNIEDLPKGVYIIRGRKVLK